MVDLTIVEFASLSPKDIHDLYQLRSNVFVVEQQCVYLDIDGLDLTALHVLCRDSVSGDLISYARVMFPKDNSNIVHVGRVVVAKSYRGRGFGQDLVTDVIKFIFSSNLTPKPIVQISAQQHLTSFYMSLGFYCTGEPYLLDGIDHIDMQLDSSTALLL